MAQLGKLIAFILWVLTLHSFYLFQSSAHSISLDYGRLADGIVIIGFIALNIILAVNRYKPINIIHGNEMYKLDNLSPLYFLLLIIGFCQTYLWVVDHKNSIHEPRSVFMLAVAGVFGYFSTQYRKVEESKTVPETQVTGE